MGAGRRSAQTFLMQNPPPTGSKLGKQSPAEGWKHNDTVVEIAMVSLVTVAVVERRKMARGLGVGGRDDG